MHFSQPESKSLPELLEFASSKAGTERRTFPNCLIHLVGQRVDTDHGNQDIERARNTAVVRTFQKAAYRMTAVIQNLPEGKLTQIDQSGLCMLILHIGYIHICWPKRAARQKIFTGALMKQALFVALSLAIVPMTSNAGPQCLNTKTPVNVSTFSKDGTFKEIVTAIKEDSVLLDVIVSLRSQGEIAYFSIKKGNANAARLPVKSLPTSIDDIDTADGSQFEVATIKLGADGKNQLAIALCNTKTLGGVVELFSFRNGKWVRDLSEEIQNSVSILPGEIFIPIGSQGLGVLYKYSNGRLVKDKGSI
jgi:hypothetical protein